MQYLYCKSCGGTLVQDSANPNRYRCTMCGKEHKPAAAEAFTHTMAAFDEQTRLKIQKLLLRRHKAVTAEYISSAEVLSVCDELLTLMPEDFISNFYKIAAGNNLRALNRAICEVDAEVYYADIADMVPFLVKSMTADRDCLLALVDLVERAYKGRDLEAYHRFATMISEQAEKVQAGVYETSMPRDVFVAYSSKDMPRVLELVEELEGNQGFTCFVAARNLRHGVGSVENYNAALAEAIDNCRTVVFVSTMNSRNFGCDALKIELSYIMQQDIAAAPAEYRNNYEAIPARYKKPRVEFRVEDSARPNAADRKVAQFFAGYEWVLTAADVADRVADQIFNAPNPMTAAHGTANGTAQPPHTPAFNAEEEIQRRVAEELRRRAEEEERQRAEVEARRRAEEERQRAEAEARRRAEEEARQRAEAERQRQAEAERQRQEAERQRQAEARCRAEEAARWRTVGGTVTFGTKDSKPIEWIVLAVEGHRALVLSKDVIGRERFYGAWGSTWDESDIREHINGSYFLNSLFTPQEQARIVLTKVKTPGVEGSMWIEGFNTFLGRSKVKKVFFEGGEDTTDRLFLLSYDEVERYPIVPASTWWWLRSPSTSRGEYNFYAACVKANGELDYMSSDDSSGGLRPAMWVTLDS